MYSHIRSVQYYATAASDVVGGTSKYTNLICELFCRLKDYPNSVAPWLTSILDESDLTETPANVAIATESAAASSLDMSEHYRVALEEPDESVGLL
jgi:hypothetical protein